MSLQVWLPLNGSLENLGLDSFNFTQSIASGYEDGKIGKALQMKNSNVDFIVPSLINAKEFSVAFWYKAIADGTITTNWNKVLRFKTKNADGTSGSDFRFESSYAASVVDTHGLSVHNNASQSIGTVGHQIIGPKGSWHHACFTHTPTDNYTYLDGVQIRYGVGAAGTLTGRVIIAGASPYPNGLMNDLRVYDHALSAKEVKELFKGLVAHYPLNDFLLTNFSSEGNIIPDYKDMKLGSANPSTGTWRIAGSSNMTRSRVHIDDSPIGECYCFVNSGIQTANDGSCYGIDSFPLSANTEYRISMFARIINGEEGYAGYNIFNIADELGGSHSKIDKNYRVTTLHPDGSWTYCWYHFKTNSANARNIYIGITTGSTTVTTQMCLVRIEEWQEWMSDNTIYDCSGYGHNGTLSPTPPVVATDSARYFTCMEFNGSSNYIDLGVDTWLPTDAVTVSVWAYMDTWGSSRFISCTESGGWNFEAGSGGGWRFPVYKNGIGYCYAVPVKKWADYTSGWHHIVGTFDGYVSRIYIDAELDSVSTNATPGTKALIKYNQNAKLFIGCEANTASPIAPYFPGKISDVRIYCTALSAEDIKALYETSVSIDDKGNFHAYEISEV